jgi:hypothetical protein
MVYSENRFLSIEEMTENAQYILDYLFSLGWTKNAICGMLGNMQTESSINPGIWQNLDEGNTSLGFGLVQWTPATKMRNWATSNGLNPDEMDSNIQRIIYEVQNNIQWINSSMTFYEFTQSTISPEQCAYLFISSYERPADPDQPNRQTQARYWYDLLVAGSHNGGGEDGLPVSSADKDLMHLLLCDSLNGWKF